MNALSLLNCASSPSKNELVNIVNRDAAAGDYVYVDLLLYLVAEFGILEKLLEVLKIKCTDISRIREDSLSKA